MNKKRIRVSKPILFSLSAAVAIATGASATVALTLAQTQQRQEFTTNLLATENVDRLPGYNTTNDQMFRIKPNNISRFSFNSVRKGTNPVTPYGWIGVADTAEDRFKEIALTNWSGELLWRTRLNLADLTKIFDIKYDVGTNAIFVLASNKQSGAFDTNYTNNEADTNFYVLDAVTGQILKNESWLTGNGRNWITKAREEIKKEGWGCLLYTSDAADECCGV